MPVEFQIATTSETPPGGWRVTVPETRHAIVHYDYTSFLKQYEDHCLANRITLEPDYEDRLMDQMCRENMATWHTICKRVGVTRKRKPAGFAAIMQFLNVIKKWLLDQANGEAAFVSAEEATRRARICATCPLNSKKVAFGCGGCQGQYTALSSALVGRRKTIYHDSLGSCGICGCALSAAIWFPIAAQTDGLTESMKEQFRDPQIASYCWKSQGLT